MDDLRQLKCVPCRGDEPPLTEVDIAELKLQVPDWEIPREEGIPHLRRIFKFKNFAQALAFTNKVGELAEAEDHHPALLTEWGKVTVTWWTHKINGLHRNDFIMAVRCDDLYAGGGV